MLSLKRLYVVEIILAKIIHGKKTDISPLKIMNYRIEKRKHQNNVKTK